MDKEEKLNNEKDVALLLFVHTKSYLQEQLEKQKLS